MEVEKIKNKEVWKVHEAVYKNSLVSPTKPAIICGERSYTYNQLWNYIQAIARWLGEKLAKESRVGLLMENSLESVGLFYGSSLAGMISVPLDSNIHSNNLRYILEDCSPSLIVVSKKHIPKIEEAGTVKGSQVLIVDDDDNGLDRQLRRNGNGRDVHKGSGAVETGSVVNILYTTGTTGMKKGVMLGHKNLIAGSRNICEFMRMNSEIVEILSMPFSHSFGYARLRSVLEIGGTGIIYNGLLRPERIFFDIQTYHANALSLVPQGFMILTNFYRDQLASIAAQLRWIEIGSSFMEQSQKTMLMEMCPNARICMHYGMTEASRSAFIEFHSESAYLHTVGRPSPGIKMKILDEDNKDVEIGETGEIMIKGDTVMQGYWGQRELSRRNLHGDWLRTGDIGLIDSDGYVHLQGRRDEIINVGGMKVAPEEIEVVLLRYKGISEVAVTETTTSDSIAGVTISAYVVTDDPSLDLKTVEKFCHDNLEPYKVPTVFKKVHSLPRTSSGKIQRHLIRRET